MPESRRERINAANPGDLSAQLRQLSERAADGTFYRGLGDILGAGRMRPPRERTGLDNVVEHVHDQAPAGVYAVYVTPGTPLAIVSGVAPGAGQVRMEIDADTGVPTFTFAAATTSYWIVSGGELPQNLAARLAEGVFAT